MKMRLLALMLTVVALPLAGANLSDQVELTRTQIEADRQAIVASAMTLTEKQSKEFWPMYKEYRADLDKLGDRKVAMLSTFADHYDQLNDEIARSLLAESFKVRKDELDLKVKWSRKFAKVLSAKENARFFQIENKLDAVIQAELAAEVPLAQK